jgi:uncharacterized protein involved in exopolysaccharide biosynthesis
MTMLQSYSSQQPVLYEDHGQNFDLSYFIGILKRRIRYFAIPFLIIVMLGSAIVEIQRPIYRAEGKILVESPEIPPELVHPTITEVANERVQVIQQRIMARDDLMAVVNKYDLFPRERAWMSGTELLDLIRSRMEIKPVDLNAQTVARPNNPTIAFTLSFDYEVPNLAMRVANEFLTSILSQDAKTRTNNAAETTKFLEREVRRLEVEHDATVAQLEAARQRPTDPEQEQSKVKLQIKTLTDLEAELIKASSQYSDAHPAVIKLKKQVAAQKQAIAAAKASATDKAPSAVPTADKASSADVPTADKAPPGDVPTIVLERKEYDLERSLEDANRKLTAARLGESMERGQQGERLQVIEQPSLPQKPVRPKKLKWFAVAFGLAGMIGAGSIFAAEMLDGSIRSSRELTGIVDRHLIVTIPYLTTPGEQYRKRRNFILLCTALVAVLAAAIAAAVIKGVSIDFSWFDRSWIDWLSRLLH